MINLDIKPTEEQLAKVPETKKALNALYVAIEAEFPVGREKSLIFTNLDVAILWIREAIMKL